jgi:RNA polymerase sigma factor FliA
VASSRTPEQVLRYVADVGVGLALAWLLEGTGMVDEGERATAMPFYRNAELEQTRERLLQLVKDLPAQQSKVITAHYLQQVPFEQIALSMGLTKGRISQIHKQALAALRTLLGTHPSCDVGW